MYYQAPDKEEVHLVANSIVLKDKLIVKNSSIVGTINYSYKDTFEQMKQWLNDVRHGKGKIYNKNGQVSYDGTFVNDFEDGNGEFIYSTERLLKVTYFISEIFLIFFINRILLNILFI